MMRLPRFRYLGPRDLAEAAAMLSDAGPDAMVVAGGTDLYPNMKRRHQTPTTLVGLRRVEALRGVRRRTDRGWWIGPATSLADLEREPALAADHRGLAEAIHAISTPILRIMGTLGGNLCLDTRCNYYNQTYEWRRSIDFCMKKDGAVCWVAPGSDVCLAISSSDTAPVMCALDARVHLVSRRGIRILPARDLWRRDGIRYLAKNPDEILAAVELPPASGWRSSYRKLRRRGAFDFPVLGVAAAARFEGDVVAEARIWLGAVSMAPVEATEAQAALAGRRLDDGAIDEAARLALPRAKPVDNTDFGVRWRKEMARHLTAEALRALRVA